MMGQDQRQAKPKRSTVEAAKEPSMDLTLLAAGASVLLALHQYFMKGNHQRGMFIGLWPPTILAFASYFNDKRMEEKMESMRPSSIVNSIDEMLSNR